MKSILTFPHLACGSLSIENPATNSQTDYAVEVLTACNTESQVRSGSIELRADRIDTLNPVFDAAIPQMRHFSRMAVPMVTHGEQFRMSLPGYSPYGRRSFTPVSRALSKFGITTEPKGNHVLLSWPEKSRLEGRKLVTPSAMRCLATSEAMLRAAVAMRGESTIINIAQDPDIADLVRLYETFAPVEFEGKGTANLVVRSEGIDVGRDYHSRISVPGDYLEASTLAAAVLAVGGDVIIDGVEGKRMLPMVPVIEGFGATIELGETGIRVIADGKPRAYDFTTERYPGFPTDAQGPFLTVAALARGASIVEETVWTNRLAQSAELSRMGARIELINNQTARIDPTPELVGTSVVGTCPRATAGLIIAGLAAEGETTVSGLDLLRNAYSRLEDNLISLGAKIELVESDEATSRINVKHGRLEAF
ncbi:hypothetical protein AWJ14_09205 [Hoeflea olei]|uniref:UDP-N-acetylglucosamine 1-carboxyvinyltransferase n=1 Tax=Hoeflea olei TaxID=1480615 RepID=A0A1C1Z0P5_9HYPH|nr:hypothetical protein AWJ14_09205 [Hoeflea olei]